MIRVMHIKPDAYRAMLREKVTPDFPHDFETVAIVATESEDHAFRLTNHIDGPWWENQMVVRYSPDARSTSVGDVMMMLELDGVRFLRCAAAGWEEMDVNEPLALAHAVFSDRTDLIRKTLDPVPLNPGAYAPEEWF